VNNWGLVAVGLLVAGCASQVVRTPEQAKAIALASACARADVALDPGETILTEWRVERRDDRWYVWLPQGPGTKLPRGTALRSAWIDAKDGKVAYCDGRYK
jgi:hypothetical protein